MTTLKMPTDPSGTPSGFFDFLDPSQETSSFDETSLLSDRSPSLDFVTSFEADLDSCFGVMREEEVEIVREIVHVPVPPVVDVRCSIPLAPSVPRRAPSMPTIVEEDEEEDEEGDVTITPSAAQKALLPPDRFARPRSASQPGGAAAVSGDADDDMLETPRPNGEHWHRLSREVTSVTDRPNDNDNPHSPSKYLLRTRSRPIRC